MSSQVKSVDAYATNVVESSYVGGFVTLLVWGATIAYITVLVSWGPPGGYRLGLGKAAGRWLKQLACVTVCNSDASGWVPTDVHGGDGAHKSLHFRLCNGQMSPPRRRSARSGPLVRVFNPARACRSSMPPIVLPCLCTLQQRPPTPVCHLLQVPPPLACAWCARRALAAWSATSCPLNTPCTPAQAYPR
jgi:hypothetical protein